MQKTVLSHLNEYLYGKIKLFHEQIKKAVHLLTYDSVDASVVRI